MDFLGKKCPICEQNFHAYDDVVVCPECGTPYHRECFDSKGECIFKELHGIETPEYNKDDNINDANTQYTGSTENTSYNESTAQSEDIPKQNICRMCGQANRKDALFCDKCGAPLNSNTNFGPYGTNVPPMFDPMAGVNPDEELCDGVNAGEAAKYVKNNTQYYMYVFNKISKSGGTGRFNFSAMLFSGGWMLYRKQYVKGAIITAIIAILMIGSMFLSATYSNDVYEKVIQDAGLSESATASELYSSVGDFMTAFDSLSGSEKLLYFLPITLDLIRYGISITIGVLGNKMYYKHCMKEIKKIKSDTSNDNISASEKLQTQGGVNNPIAFCLIICLLIINYIPLFFL